jgi:hypothetical protein
VAFGQVGDRPVPPRDVHYQPVQEHDGAVAGVLVVDGPGAGRSAEGHVVMDMNIVAGGPFWRRLSAVTASPRSATYS